MAKDIVKRYIWIVDTLNRYGKLTRADINDLWLAWHESDGMPIPERTFFHYRRAIEENFHIQIDCNRYGEYYISQGDSVNSQKLTNWLLDSYAVNMAMMGQSIASERIQVEDVPSAREFLPLVLESISANRKVCFTYAGFSRSRQESEIVFHPYFVKRYNQRWYMIGMREKTGDVRTYALDRVKEMTILKHTFEMPKNIDPATYFNNLIGVTYSKASPRVVKLRATSSQAKYFRVLPLHHTQQEELNDNYSIFTYKLKLNYELVHEILSYGKEVTVLEPRELRVMVEQELREALENYEV